MTDATIALRVANGTSTDSSFTIQSLFSKSRVAVVLAGTPESLGSDEVKARLEPAHLGSRIGINPGFGEIDDEPFSILRTLETICKAADCMRVSPALAFPRDLRSPTPFLRALVKRCVGYDQPIVVV